MNYFPSIQSLQNSPVAKLKNNYNYMIGIDPGTKTGVCVYHNSEKWIRFLETMLIHKAFEEVKSFANFYKEYGVLVRIEDARKRTWFGNTGKERLKGAGSVERDCKIWEDFLTDNKIDFELVHPKNNKTKMSSDAFKKITGWKEKTSQHARDAAMLCFGF